MDTLEGGCLCGRVRYRIEGAVSFTSQCCCRDCQKATGTGHTTILGIRRSQLEVAGEPKTFTNTRTSSMPRTRSAGTASTPPSPPSSACRPGSSCRTGARR